jgi:hypothetical protein
MYVTHLDVCFPDDFQGHNGHVYAIPCTGSDRMYQVKAKLLDAIDSEEVWPHKEDRSLTDAEYEELRQSIIDMFDGIHPLKRFDPGCWTYAEYCKEQETDEPETPYAYFGVEGT